MNKKELIKNLTKVIKSNQNVLSKQDLNSLKRIREELKASETKEEIASVILKLIQFFELVKEVIILLVENFQEPPS